MNVLLVEDDKRIAQVLEQGLEEDGHRVYTSHRGKEGCELIQSNHFDVAVLDVMLPEMDGFSILRQVRSAKCGVPILMLTAKDAMPDVVRGLDLGADDYLTKPFQLEVFLARVRAISRRGQIAQETDLNVGDLLLHRGSRTVYRNGTQLSLTKKEYVLLELLMRRANHIVTRDQLIEAGWGYDAEVRDNSLEFYIHSLRTKIDQADAPSRIRTIRALGYSLV
jgi:two-component system, OmpR family, copper resistance phosphate regulon response regulator CusR